MALGVLQEMTRNHIRVPDDISIIGYDDIDFAPKRCQRLAGRPTITPMITTSARRTPRLGSRSG
jgi:DNA-binding LacI/PurR family transcriptional regulator